MKNQEAFLRGYKLLSIPILTKDGKSAWPEKFPTAKIDELRDTVGERHFMAQMMLDPAPISNARFNIDALRFYSDDFDRKKSRVGDTLITGWALYWDPSSGRRSADASVCVFLLRDDKNRTAYIHNCIYMEKIEDENNYPMSTQCNTVLNFMDENMLRNISIETNGLGSTLPEILQNEANRRGKSIVINRVTNRDNKALRIIGAIEPLLTTGRLFAHEKIRDTELLDEMMDWTPTGAARDDGLDAIAGALRAQPIPIRPCAGALPLLHAKTDFTV